MHDIEYNPPAPAPAPGVRAWTHLAPVLHLDQLFQRGRLGAKNFRVTFRAIAGGGTFFRPRQQKVVIPPHALVGGFCEHCLRCASKERGREGGREWVGGWVGGRGQPSRSLSKARTRAPGRSVRKGAGVVRSLPTPPPFPSSRIHLEIGKRVECARRAHVCCRGHYYCYSCRWRDLPLARLAAAAAVSVKKSTLRETTHSHAKAPGLPSLVRHGWIHIYKRKIPGSWGVGRFLQRQTRRATASQKREQGASRPPTARKRTKQPRQRTDTAHGTGRNRHHTTARHQHRTRRNIRHGTKGISCSSFDTKGILCRIHALVLVQGVPLDGCLPVKGQKRNVNHRILFSR